MTCRWKRGRSSYSQEEIGWREVLGTSTLGGDVGGQHPNHSHCCASLPSAGARASQLSHTEPLPPTHR